MGYQGNDMNILDIEPLSNIDAPQQNYKNSDRALVAPNHFISYATPILIILMQIKECQNFTEISTLRSYLINAIKIFDSNLAKIEKNQRNLLATRYCLCTMIDETILNTEWGAKSIWSQHSMLALFHQETHGGERFYLILENMMKELPTCLAIVEFLYLLLSIGFEGKFFGKGRIIRDEIRNRVYQMIKQLHGKVLRTLSTQWQDTQISLLIKKKRLTVKRMLIIGISILCIVGIDMNLKAHHAALSSLKNLDQIGRISPIIIYSQLVDRPLSTGSY